MELIIEKNVKFLLQERKESKNAVSDGKIGYSTLVKWKKKEIDR